MSMTVIPSLLFGLVCGMFIAKRGALIGVLLGCSLAILGHLALDVFAEFEASMYAARIVHGIAMGFFLPAVITFSKSMLTGKNETANFGVFTSMIPGANLIGPTLGEQYLIEFGNENYFFVTAIPGAISLILFAFLFVRYSKEETKHDVVHGYWQVVKEREITVPIIGIVFPGLLWGFVLTYVSLSLNTAGLSIGVFFVSLTTFLFIGRFLVLRIIGGMKREFVVLVSTVVMSLALVLVSVYSTNTVAAVSGALFGVSYSISYPVFSMWVANSISPNLKPQAVALTNTLFNTYLYSAPLLCAIFLNFTSILNLQFWYGTTLAIIAVVFFGLALVLGREKKTASI